jgi:hypothetical protein
MVSLEFFIDTILPAVLWPWGQLSLYKKWVPGKVSGGKGGQCLELTTLPPSCADFLEIWEPQSPGTLRACPWDCLTYTYTSIQHVYEVRLEDKSIWHIISYTQNLHCNSIRGLRLWWTVFEAEPWRRISRGGNTWQEGWWHRTQTEVDGK